jgi:methionyl-tRNA formyltransferase
MRGIFFVDGHVGSTIADFVSSKYPHDVAAFVTTTANSLHAELHERGFPTIVATDESLLPLTSGCDWGFLVWWPQIVREPLLSAPKNGYLNTHPSLLPHARGKHTTFWTLSKALRFGVSLHRVTSVVDSGPILAQQEIVYDWTDDSQSLYSRAQEAMIALFVAEYPRFRAGDSIFLQQDSDSPIHYASEIESASRIELENTYVARDLLNLLRARTMPGQPACWFIDQGKRHEVRISISRSQGEEDETDG